MISLTREALIDFESATSREWLVTNGIGGFASSTVSGMNTRRYHGLLISALRPPVDRVAMVSKLDVTATYRGERTQLATNEFADGAVAPHGYRRLAGFRLDGLVPVWSWVVGDALIEQRVWMEHGANTTYVSFTLVWGKESIQLELVPLCTYRDYHAQHRGYRDTLVTQVPNGVQIDAFWGARPYRILSDCAASAVAPDWYWNFLHRAERDRGLDDIEDLFRPAIFQLTLAPGETGSVILTAEAQPPTPAEKSLSNELQRQNALLDAASSHTAPSRAPGWIRQLTLAADQYIVRRAAVSGWPLAVGEDATSSASSRTANREPRTASSHTVIAGYPWFSDWGRDTMIALPGLTLSTGRYDIAASVLRTFARFVSEGMLPNRFPDAGEAPEYNTVDATLWYFVAIDEYVRSSGDRAFIAEIFPTLSSIVDWHRRGTRYGIRVDETDGLLRAGEPGVQLTWMDAKIGDWVVTPRVGKPVEINALWFNALMIMRDFAAALSDARAARDYASAAEQVARSFNERFWFDEGAYLYDVIDTPQGDDASLRPNQLFAISLRHALLDNGRAKSVVDVCARELWTPVGMRSLARSRVRANRRHGDSRMPPHPGPLPRGERELEQLSESNQDPHYAGRYIGGPSQRDAVYHQGTVWSWLLGPFALAHYRVYQSAADALAFLDGIDAHLRDACIGQISEIFDGDAPFTPRGCFAQAWGVAELLRAWNEINESRHENQSRSETHRSRATQ